MIYKENVLNFMLLAGWYGVRGQEGKVNKVCFLERNNYSESHGIADSSDNVKPKRTLSGSA